MTLPLPRTGVLAKKVGMTRVFDTDGSHVPVTVLTLESCQVVAQRTEEKDGYVALQLGAGSRKAKNVTAPLRGHYAKALVEPKAILAEFRVQPDALIEVGAEITADHFLEGQKVDIQGVTKGKGFAGAMKRWNFGGMRATHGVSVSHRAHGSTGNRQDPGRTFPGKKMAGHLGVETVTTQNLTIFRIDVERGLLMIRGAVPGADGGWVKVQDAIKRPNADVPRPGKFRTVADRANAQGADAPAAEPAAEAPAEGAE